MVPRMVVPELKWLGEDVFPREDLPADPISVGSIYNSPRWW